MPIEVNTDSNNNINIDVQAEQGNAEITLQSQSQIINQIGTTALYGPKGEDGFSPIANVSKSNNITTISITDKSGTTSTQVLDGVNGQDGSDGFSPIATVTETLSGATISITDKNGTTTANITNGADGQDGSDGQDGQDGAAATISVGTVTTGAAGSSASIVNSGTSSSAVFDFTIPKGDKGDTGSTGATGNGIVNIEKASTVGLVDTYHVNYTNGNYDSFNVTNGRDGSGAVTDVTVNGVSVLDGNVAKVLVPTDNAQLTNGAGYITGITSSDVTTALGYTPQEQLVSGTNIKTINNNSILGSGNLTLDGLPTQTGQSGKFLTTDGTDASWGNLPVATSSTVGVVKPDNASIRVDNDGTLSAICRNVGEIIASTLPLTDAGLHLLDGSLILGGGIYQGFVDYIADLYAENPSANYFTTEALWQQSVTTYGVCGKFVYDSVNNTVRLPKVTGIIEGTTDVSALGDLVEAGLPNITGSLQLGDLNNAMAVSRNAVGALGQGNNITSKYTAGGLTSTDKFGFDIDASRSSSIYGNSSTVQPQTIKAFYYIVIANSTKTEIQSDIDEIATDLNGKADVDLSNVTDVANIKMAHNAMPSNTYTDLTLGASGSTYTAPADGWYFLSTNARSSSIPTFIVLYSNNYSISSTADVSVNWEAAVLIPVRKGGNVTAVYGTTDANYTHFRFFYAVGSESEAS